MDILLNVYVKFNGLLSMLTSSFLSIVAFVTFNARKPKLFRGHLYSNAIKVILFISDAQYYVLVNYVGQLVTNICLK